jgi:hypothetical protein
MNMLFQKIVDKMPAQPTPTQGDFVPREDPPPHYDHDHEHDHDHHHIHEHAHGD